MNPLLVFGLDGASLSMLRGYVKRRPGGIFDKLLLEGASRTLISTLPYFTAPAWTTIATGLSPARHGVFHWLGRYDPNLRRRPLLSSSHLQNATFWHYIQSQGARVSVSNFPMEYPAPAVHGRYICGTLAPEDAEETTWPRGLSTRIKISQPAFRFEINKGLTYIDHRNDLKAHILEVGENHFRAMFDFSAPENADLVFHVVTVTDRMQHFFWDAHDPQHPLHDLPSTRGFEEAILETYALAEKHLQRLFDMGRWSNLLLVSDHGMGPSWTAFHADEWLRQEGYLILDEDGETDMIRSVAYSAQEPECAIYVQRLSRDSAGVGDKNYETLVAEIVQKLSLLCEPGGKLAMRRIHTATAVHVGPFAYLAPDIILEPSEGIHPRPGRSNVVFSAETRLCAGHRPNGLFLGWGENFKNEDGDNREIKVEDIFPIVMRLSGFPEPSGLDGSVPHGLLHGASDNTGLHAVPDWRLRVDGPPGSHRHSASMVERLRELGYLE